MNPFKNISLPPTGLSAIRLSFDLLSGDRKVHVEINNSEGDDLIRIICITDSEGKHWIPVEEIDPELASEEFMNKLEFKKGMGLHGSAWIIDKDLKKEICNVRRNYIEHWGNSGLLDRGPVFLNIPKIESHSERVDAYVLFADLRDFSTWSLHSEPEYIEEIFDFMSYRVSQMLGDYGYSYWKLLGDGIMLVWEDNRDNISDKESEKYSTADSALGAAYELHKKYWYYKKEAKISLPAGFGIAVVGGRITKVKSVLGFESSVIQDYVGPLVNQAARWQGIARPGQVIVNRNVVKSSKWKWYEFDNVTNEYINDTKNIKGVPITESEIYSVCHSQFNSDWERFCIKP